MTIINIPVKIHLLHIGKTGGTAIKYALKNTRLYTQNQLNLHNHKTKLEDIPPGDQIILFLRDPISRFISGFYSRKRKGKPRYNSDWNSLEIELFSNFSTPNEMVNSLKDKQSINHDLAKQALIKIKHLRSIAYWLSEVDYIKHRKNDFSFIGFQENLEEDFKKLKIILNLPTHLTLPCDPVQSHKSPDGLDKYLSADNFQYLQKVYEQDYRIINYCKTLDFL